MSQFIIIRQRPLAEGGTLANEIGAGDVVHTPRIGPLKVSEVTPLMSEGARMIALEFVGFPEYVALMPETFHVDVARTA